MNVRRSLAAALLAALSTIACLNAAVGCRGDECTRGDDHFAECTTTDETSSTASGMPMAQACTGVRLCQSQCINNHTCTQIQANDPSFSECLTKCLGK